MSRNLVNGKIQFTYGGGICQVAGILYHLALMAGLDILERHSHSLDIYTEVERFTPLGADATVVYGYKDLRIRNNTGHPICFEIYITGNEIGDHVSDTFESVRHVIPSTDPLPIAAIPIAKPAKTKRKNPNGAAEICVFGSGNAVHAIHPAVAAGEPQPEPTRQVQLDTNFRRQCKNAVGIHRIVVVAQTNFTPADSCAGVEVDQFMRFVGVAQPKTAVTKAKVVIVATDGIIRRTGANTVAAEKCIVEDERAAAADHPGGFTHEISNLHNGAAKSAYNVQIVEQGLLLSLNSNTHQKNQGKE